MTGRFPSPAPAPTQDARALLAAVVESSDDAIITKTLDGKITSWNASAERLFGYTAAEIIGQPITVLIPPDRREEERHIIENLRAGNRIEHYETVRVRKDGRLFDVSLTVSPVRDQTGQIVGASKILRDITAAKAQALRAAHDTFRNLVDHSPFGVYAVNADFQIVQVSAGARRAFANVDPVIGRDLGEALRILWPESFAKEAISRFRHTLESGEPYHAPSTVERRADLDAVESYDWKIERMILPDGRFGVVCHFYDLTERQRFQAALQASEERFRLASDAAGACVFDVDVTGQHKVIVHGLQGVTGYRSADVDVTMDWWLSLIHPDDLPTHRENLARHLKRGGPYNAVFRIQRKDGEWIWVEATAQVIKNDAGEAVQVVGAVVDVTARRNAEEALRSSEQRFRRLHGVSSRLLAASDLSSALGDVLENAIASCGAVYGNIQLLNPRSHALEIVAHRGFKQEFLDHFREVHVEEGSACAQALQSGERMIIEDVELDPSFAPHRPIAAAAGYRAVQSTPLKAHDGRVVGMLSTHFRAPHRVPESDQQQLDLYARHAADLIIRVQYEQALRDAERRAAAAADVAKSEFLASIRHDIRTPLNSIVGFTDLLLQSQPTEEQRTQLEYVNRAGRDLLALMNVVIGDTRLDPGCVTLNEAVFDRASSA